MSHLFGRILNPSLGNHFVTEWTSSLEVTPANHSAQQERDLAQKTQDIFGLTSQAEFGFFDPSSASLKTSKDTPPLDSEKSLENWNKWVTKCRGEYSLRVKSAHLTRENECLSWPSPIASEVRQGFQDRSRGMKGSQESLTTVVVKDAANWPTPDVSDRRGPNFNQKGLSNSVKHGLPAPANPSMDGNRQESWATPQAKDHKSGHRDATIVQYKQLNVEVEARATGKLNPRWVETLMGLPIGWTMPSCKSPVTIVPTNSDCLETELSQPQQREHSELF
jgi:hypothetical protein